jgi:hypothetical protein
MPQAALTDGELLKKTLRTTLLMVGSTALWLGVLSGAVVLTTGAPESKVEKATVGPATTGAPGGTVLKGAGLGGLKAVRGRSVGTSKDGVHPGDPI